MSVALDTCEVELVFGELAEAYRSLVDTLVDEVKRARLDVAQL